MAQELSVNFKDVNGDRGGTRFWCNDVPTAQGAIQALANLSNAQVVAAWMSLPVDLGSIANLKTAAVAANNETVYTNAKILLSGNDAGSVAAKRGYAEINIPAPIGALINGLEGNPNDPLAQAFVGKIITRHNVTTDRVDSVKYSKK